MSDTVQQQASGIRCPECKGSMKVSNSVAKPEENKHFRYRKCTECGCKVYTEEQIIRIVQQRTKAEPKGKKKKGKKLKKKKK